MKWIKCSDQIPEKDTPVLIFAGLYYGPEEERMICTAEYDGHGYWSCVGASGAECEDEFDYKKVTHWMPLPSPPQEQM